MATLWMENGPVLLLATIHDVLFTNTWIVSRRRRPRETSTNSTAIRKVFGEQARKEPKIPRIINDNNHKMNGVDLADQYRSYYNLQLVSFRAWMPLFF